MNRPLIKEVMTRIRGKHKTAQVKPANNADAHMDIRNFISSAAANCAIASEMDACQIINADMTSVGIGGKQDRKTIVTEDHDPSIPVQMQSIGSGLCHFVKYFTHQACSVLIQSESL